MSHEVDIHPAQTKILRELLFHQSAGFAKLQKPTGLTSDHFKFHIQRLVELGYVKKLSPGVYALTAKGKEHANKLDTDVNTLERQPKVSVVLMVERQRGNRTEFLCQQRLKNPYYGWWGRLGGKVRWGESFEQAAKRELKEEAGLSADFTFKMLHNKRDYTEEGRLLEHKVFIIMHTDKFSGSLVKKFEGGLNEWLTQEELENKPKTFDSAVEFAELLDTDTHYYDRNYYYAERDY